MGGAPLERVDLSVAYRRVQRFLGMSSVCRDRGEVSVPGSRANQIKSDRKWGR